jgi:DNA-directed RNA polymerase subunit M/transcription elongation factor TFIIS
MVDGEIPECPECSSTEVVVHKREVATSGDTTRAFVSGCECVECGRRWQPDTELTGQTRKLIGRFS